ncbi:Mitochondrial uncoupling protein 3 [Bienertia sinuspersici]
MLFLFANRSTSLFIPLGLQVVASPADLVKVRMQADGRLICQGLQPRYSGPIDAFSKIVSTEGFRGLWKGLFPNMQRAILVNMGELACYDHAKRFVIKNQIADDNIYAHTLASIMSGLSATTLNCPADVVKTRMMNQVACKDGKLAYTNSFDCLTKTVQIEGVKALWKGFFPTWARLGPWQFVFWVSYEKFRTIAGLSSF